MDAKIQTALNGIVEAFKTGAIPKAVAYSMFPQRASPSSQWSFRNRVLMTIAGTGDARGFRQWKEVDRAVKKGAKAFYILIPLIKTEEGESGEDIQSVYGFKGTPVFRLEDTYGKPLEDSELILPAHNLIEVAESWGIAIKAVPRNYVYYGYYSSTRNLIALATKAEQVFFHELAHAAHYRLRKGLKSGQDPVQEIVAELASQALCRLVGKQESDTLGNSFHYIEAYAKRLRMSAVNACLYVLGETEKVLNLILFDKKNAKLERQAQPCNVAAVALNGKENHTGSLSGPLNFHIA